MDFLSLYFTRQNRVCDPLHVLDALYSPTPRAFAHSAREDTYSMANPLFPWGNMPLVECDPDVADLIEKEKNRQWRGLELIASEVGATGTSKDHLVL